ncbi:uncharacterized protein LOC143834493 [Paroedura picta]|uniref:uncharacterized protein LOC143834493 n=1 Tax=Paroedura picta TaxID=143630 RepID=UPI004057992F
MSNSDDTSENTYLQGEPSEQMAASERQSLLWCFKWSLKKRNIKLWIFIVLQIFLHVILFVIWWSAIKKEAAGQSPTCPCSPWIISCPESWVGYQGRCYYFSESEGTWDFSQRQCSSYGASLASIDTQREMEFLMRYKTSADHWYGLRKKADSQQWKWTNDSIFNNWFHIEGKGFCAYLNDGRTSSARCDTPKNWICSRALHSFCREKPPHVLTNTSSLDNGYQLMNCSMPGSYSEAHGRYLNTASFLRKEKDFVYDCRCIPLLGTPPRWKTAQLGIKVPGSCPVLLYGSAGYAALGLIPLLDWKLWRRSNSTDGQQQLQSSSSKLWMENEPFELTREHESSENEPNSRDSTQTQQTSNGLQETIEDRVNGVELDSCPREGLSQAPEAQDCNNRLLGGMDHSRSSSNAAFLGGRREIEQCKHRNEKWKILRLIQKDPQFVLLVFVIVPILIMAFGVIGFFLGKWTESAAPWHCVSCPEWWVGYKEKCYYFSETEGTWNSSQRNCSSHGASLASIDSQQEMDFLKHFKGHKRFWIGLQREAVGEPWKWTNGSIFNDWFNVAADGLCAYLDDDVSSTFCDSQRYWICSKSF